MSNERDLSELIRQKMQAEQQGPTVMVDVINPDGSHVMMPWQGALVNILASIDANLFRLAKAVEALQAPFVPEQ